MRRPHNAHHDHDGGGVGFLLSIPILIVLSLFGGLAWFVARSGGSYRLTRVFVFPVTFVASNFFGGMFFLCFGLLVGVLTGNKALANYVVGHTADLTMLTILFNEIDIPQTHIMVFQIILWFVMGRRLTRHVTLSIYDLAIQSLAADYRVKPRKMREHIRQHDKAYAEADDIYYDTGKPPLLGLILVGLSRTPIAHYY